MEMSGLLSLRTLKRPEGRAPGPVKRMPTHRFEHKILLAQLAGFCIVTPSFTETAHGT